MWKRVLRRSWPWLVGIAIVIAIVTRVPLDAFRGAIDHGPHLTLAAVDMLVVIAILLTDTFATWVALIAVRARWPLPKTFAVRGATYVLSLINYAVGQGGIGYYLHRDGMKPLRAAGVTLFMMGTTFATLIVLTAVTWTMSGESTSSTMFYTLVGLCGAFALYLAVIVASPGLLVRRELLAPLFATGLAGHALAIAGRLPHVVIIVLGHWIAFRAWGIPVPFGYAMAVLPAVVIAAVLPISPAGLGTTQAALIYFFSDFAPEAVAADRQATILAFGIVHFVYATAGQLAVGLACVPFARRFARPADQPSA